MKKFTLKYYDYDLIIVEESEVTIINTEKAYQQLLQDIDAEMLENDYFDFSLVEIY